MRSGNVLNRLNEPCSRDNAKLAKACWQQRVQNVTLHHVPADPAMCKEIVTMPAAILVAERSSTSGIGERGFLSVVVTDSSQECVLRPGQDRICMVVCITDYTGKCGTHMAQWALKLQRDHDIISNQLDDG